MTRLTLCLLGPLQVTLDDRPVAGLAYAKVRALLAYLAVEARPHSRDALAELLWSGQPAAVARRSLRVALATLRQALGDPSAATPFLISTRNSVQLNPASAIALDIASFSELIGADQVHFHSDGALCPRCVARLTQALSLYRGDFLEHLVVRGSAAFDEWLMVMHERMHYSALDALAALTDYHEGRREDELARQYAWRTLNLEPWDEAAHRCVMRVLARKGRRNAALAQYERCRQTLADELGIEPSEETAALCQQLRAGAPALARTRTVGALAPLGHWQA